MQSPRSLLLITVDCFRADHAGFLGYRRPTTPFLDSLAQESLVFSNAIVAGAPTYFSFPAIMASRYPLSLGRDVVGLAPRRAHDRFGVERGGLCHGGVSGGESLSLAALRLRCRVQYVFKDFLDTEAGPLSADPGSGGNNTRVASRWNRRLANVSHALGPVGSLYDELYFQYCQRWDRRPYLRSTSCGAFPRRM